jgi:Ca-activated chloride channel family protein
MRALRSFRLVQRSAAEAQCLAVLPIVLVVLLLLAALCFPASAVARHAQHKKPERLPRQLDKGITWHRDPATGELHVAIENTAARGHGDNAQPDEHVFKVVTQMVPVTCIVSAADGAAVPGLRRSDFRVFEDGIERPVAYFDASTQPASVALVIDASPSVLRDSQEMKRAADALVGALAPLDQAAVVDFSAHTYLQLPFTDVREPVLRAVARIDVRAILGDTGGSNIYEAVYLAARELFRGRQGRKAIVLLTDGQDSGLGLTLDPESAMPQPGEVANRLTFDDVARLLASQDIQLFAVSTENRPKVMTPDWLATHANATLVTAAARSSGIPPYTLYLAELVRRAGGQLYFLNETSTVAGTFRQIAQKIRAEYTLGFYPSRNPAGAAVSTQHAETGLPAEALAQAGWHSLRVELVDQPGARVSHRAAYYVPIAR